MTMMKQRYILKWRQNRTFPDAIVRRFFFIVVVVVNCDTNNGSARSSVWYEALKFIQSNDKRHRLLFSLHNRRWKFINYSPELTDIPLCKLMSRSDYEDVNAEINIVGEKNSLQNTTNANRILFCFQKWSLFESGHCYSSKIVDANGTHAQATYLNREKKIHQNISFLCIIYRCHRNSNDLKVNFFLSFVKLERACSQITHI